MENENVSKEEVESFFGPIEEYTPDTEDILEGATPVEIKSWDIEDFIVEAVHKNADKAIERARELANKPEVDIFNKEEREQFVEKVEATKEKQSQPEAIAQTMKAFETVKESVEFDPTKGDRNFKRSLKVMKRELEKHIAGIYKKESVQMLKKVESMGGGGGSGDLPQTRQNTSDIATLSADVGEFENVTTNQREQFQGYIALLSPVYFGGSATTFDIPLESVNTFLDLELDVYNPGGEFDYRVTSMKTANAEGYVGTGATSDPIIFLLEGLEQTSSANIRVSLSFNPDDDGGRFESRLLFNRHSGIPLSGTDFSIEASAIAMESGAEEDYAYTPSIQFFVGDTIDTNGAGDAGKVRFQVKSDVPGTVTVNEIAMFIQK